MLRRTNRRLEVIVRDLTLRDRVFGRREIRGRKTADGRLRAPEQLWGPRRHKGFRWFQIVCGIGFIWYHVREYTDHLWNIPDQQRFLNKVVIVPHGVLGTQFSLQGGMKTVAGMPDDEICITDPAGMHHIKGVAEGAGGAAGAIYNWLGLKGQFPEVVRNAMHRTCDAKFYNYGAGKKVIHCVGPDFREGDWSEREATLQLSRAYRNILHEFILSGSKELRLLPVSSGIFAGDLYNQIPPMTQEALSLAFEQLHEHDRKTLLRSDKFICLCIFMEREWDHFMNVFRYVEPAQQLQ